MGGSAFTPKQRNWRVFADAAGPSVGDALASENVKPTLADNTSILRFRVSIAETGGKASNNAVTILEYSINQADWFSLGAAAHWDHADGADVDGEVISYRLLSDSDGKGRYCESAASTVSYPASTVTENDMAIVPTGNVSAETTYYFRTLIAGTAVPLDTAETYPQVFTTTASLPERTANLSVSLAGAVCAAAATLAATAALAAQLSGATVGSGATSPIAADLGKTLSGTTLASTATAESGLDERFAALGITLDGTAVSSGATAPTAGAASVQLDGASLEAEGSGAVVVDLAAGMEGAALSSGATVPVVADSGVALAGASVQSGVSVPVGADAAVQLAGATLSATASGIDSRTADLSVQLASAGVSSGATVPVVADVSVSLTGATLQATASTDDSRTAELSVVLEGATVAAAGTVPVVADLSGQLAGATVASTAIGWRGTHRRTRFLFVPPVIPYEFILSRKTQFPGSRTFRRKAH